VEHYWVGCRNCLSTLPRRYLSLQSSDIFPVFLFSDENLRSLCAQKCSPFMLFMVELKMFFPDFLIS
jgi:hypothetical protein